MNTPSNSGYFAYWNAQDYVATPRRIRGLQLFLNTGCHRQCPECAANIPNIRYPEHYPLDDLRHTAECFYGIEHVSVTGGEPTLHPQFRELVPHLKTWFGCRSLALETNGCHLNQYQDLLGYFDDILLSHYPDNEEQTALLAALGIDGRPAGPTVHVTTARRARHPAPCRRANFVQSAYGRVYPCAIPAGFEGIGIPLTPNWRADILKVPLPCADCCFAEETSPHPLSLFKERGQGVRLISPHDGQGPREVRPAWRWPQLRDDIKIYGLDLDSWMGREAQIRINPHQSMHRLLIHFESSAPQALHPLTLRFLNQQGETVTTHRVERAGVAVVPLELPQFFTRPDDSWITVRCDKTFTDANRELGIRVCSLRYLAQQEPPLYAEHLRLIEEYSHQIEEYSHQLAITEGELVAKEEVIQSQRQELFVQDEMNRLFRRTSFWYWGVHRPKRLLKGLLPEFGQRPLRRLRQQFQPKLGVLSQYAPRPWQSRTSHEQNAIVAPTGSLPTISMITPSLNQGRFLERTIKSVIDQQYPHLEYLIQDGGSTDETSHILAQYLAHITAVESERDGGQANAINAGFRHATGEIMAWLNSDDLLLPGALSYVANFFRTHPAVDVVYGHRLIIDEQDWEIGRWILPPHDETMLLWADYIPQETLFWRRSLWEKAGGYVDEAYHFALDWELLLRFRAAGAAFARLPRFLAAFRVHPQQKTAKELESTGKEEMARLRQRCHGRDVSEREAAHHLHDYMWKHLVYDALYRWKVLSF